MARSAAPTAAQLRSLHELRQARGGDVRKGVMLCPAPATVDEWEAVAVPQQAALMTASLPDRDDARDLGGGLADVTSQYKKDRARP